jgi:hypothetical protein
VYWKLPLPFPAATALTICSIKAGSENGFDQLPVPLVGVYYLPPICLIPRALIHLPNRTTNNLEVSLTRPFPSTLMLQVYERRCRPRDPSLDHFHYENSDHFPELRMDQSWLFALFSPSWNTFQNHIIILVPGIATWALKPKCNIPHSGIKTTISCELKNRVINFFSIYIHGLRIKIYRNFNGVSPILEGPKLSTCNLFILLITRIS